METVEFDTALLFLNKDAMLLEIPQSYPEHSIPRAETHHQVRGPRNLILDGIIQLDLSDFYKIYFHF